MGHGQRLDNQLEVENSANDEFERKRTAQSREHTRQKRGFEIIKNDSSDSGNSDNLKSPKESIATSDDVFLEHHEPLSARDRDRYRLRAKLSIMKDDVQTVLPIAKVCLCIIYLNTSKQHYYYTTKTII